MPAATAGISLQGLDRLRAKTIRQQGIVILFEIGRLLQTRRCRRQLAIMNGLLLIRVLIVETCRVQ